MSTSRKTVFVIEDDADVCESLNAVVSTLGYVCRSFQSAESLFAELGNAQCDFLIIDVDLPEMNGADLLKQLRATGNETPALFFTGRVDDRVLKAAAALGDVPVIQKGGSIRNIIDCLQASLAAGDDQDS